MALVALSAVRACSRRRTVARSAASGAAALQASGSVPAVDETAVTDEERKACGVPALHESRARAAQIE